MVQAMRKQFSGLLCDMKFLNHWDPKAPEANLHSGMFILQNIL